jgi:hypothetical protein
MLRATANALRVTAQQLLNSVDSLSTQIDQVAAFVHAGGVNAGTEFSSFPGQGQGGVKDHLKRSYSDYTLLGSGGLGGGSRGEASSRPAKKARKMKLDPTGCTDCGFTGKIIR